MSVRPRPCRPRCGGRRLRPTLSLPPVEQSGGVQAAGRIERRLRRAEATGSYARPPRATAIRRRTADARQQRLDGAPSAQAARRIHRHLAPVTEPRGQPLDRFAGHSPR